MITRRDLVVAALAAASTLTAVTLAEDAKPTAAAPPPAPADARILDSTAWNWDEFEARKTDVGQYRRVVRQPTRTLDELEMHITTLNPHTTSHPPHTHPNEEMVILKEGKLQAHVNGKEVVVGPGAVLFYASMQPHGVKNVGDTPATYYVINWAAPGTLKKPPAPTGLGAQ
jgi:quercetin dioxygenase-like cupin family protein